jgi:ABC-type Fe3+ transport system permease subunit
MFDMTGKSTLGIGGLAFLAGVVATLVTAYAVATRNTKAASMVRNQYDGWDDDLGV